MRKKQLHQKKSLAISATPVLKGKAAERFRKLEIANRTKCAPKKEVEHAVNLFCDVLKNSESLPSRFAKIINDNILDLI